jgi:hypothetical protein
VGTAIYGWFQPGVELLGFNPPINVRKAMQIQLVLGGRLDVDYTVRDCNGVGVDLTGIPIDAIVTGPDGTVYAKFGIELFDQTLNPGKIRLYALPIMPEGTLTTGTYRRDIPENCTYAILLNFTTGPRFAAPPADFVAIQSPQNQVTLGVG